MKIRRRKKEQYNKKRVSLLKKKRGFREYFENCIVF